MNTKHIKDDQQYRVELAEKVALFGQFFYPGHTVTLRGDVLKQIARQVKDAKPV